MVPGVGEEAEMDDIDRGLEPTTVPTGSATDRSTSHMTSHVASPRIMPEPIDSR